MDKNQLKNICLNLKNTYEDYPFDEEWTVIRHKGSKKCFAFIFEKEGLKINLKCEPMQAAFLRRQYSCITPAYHMNKEHWISVLADGSVPLSELAPLLDLSYQLASGRTRRPPPPEMF